MLATRARWANDDNPWLFAVLARIDGILASRDTRALMDASPMTDPETAAALAGLPTGFAERLTLDLTLEVGGRGTSAGRVFRR